LDGAVATLAATGIYVASRTPQRDTSGGYVRDPNELPGLFSSEPRGGSRVGTRRSAGPRMLASAGAAAPFAHLEAAQPELQAMLREDIQRRLSELILLGWLGRAFLAVPFLFARFAPSVFHLDLYEGEGELCVFTSDTSGAIECTLRESSVVSRGIPVRLRIEPVAGADADDVGRISLVGVGCDVLDAVRGDKDTRVPLSHSEAEALAARLARPSTKKRLVRAVSSTIFDRLSAVSRAVEAGDRLEVCSAEERLEPRRDLFAREGSSEKWLQKISAYYFARAVLQEVRFTEGVAEGVGFTFYFDPEEPVNGDPRRANVNPEVVCCTFR